MYRETKKVLVAVALPHPTRETIHEKKVGLYISTYSGRVSLVGCTSCIRRVDGIYHVKDHEKICIHVVVDHVVVYQVIWTQVVFCCPVFMIVIGGCHICTTPGFAIHNQLMFAVVQEDVGTRTRFPHDHIFSKP